MTAAEISLIKDSFQKVLPMVEQAASLFQVRLLDLDPSFRRRLGSDLEAQVRRLPTLFAAAVKALERSDTPLPYVSQFGLGAGPVDSADEPCAAVGVALLWTLEKCLGSDFTPDVRRAWTNAFLHLAGTYLEARGAWQLAA